AEGLATRAADKALLRRAMDPDVAFAQLASCRTGQIRAEYFSWVRRSSPRFLAFCEDLPDPLHRRFPDLSTPGRTPTRSNGVVEYWSIGLPMSPLLQHSITPSLRSAREPWQH